MEIKFDDPRKMGRIPNGALEEQRRPDPSKRSSQPDLGEYRNCYYSYSKENSTMPPETKVNKFSHSRKDLEGWLTEAYTWRKALEGKLITESERAKTSSKEQFIQILDLANEFYQLNGIK
ncbi:45109_t:CDS:2, partial [Gigaspora margarita]